MARDGAKNGNGSSLRERPNVCSAQIGPDSFFHETGADLEQVFSELHHFRFTVGKAIGSVDDLSVREQLESVARLLDEEFAELQADTPATVARHTLWPHSSGYGPKAILHATHSERFGEQHERDFQRGIPPIHEVCEDWNTDR